MESTPIRPIHFCLDEIFNNMRLNNNEFHEVIKKLLANERLSNRIMLDSRGGWQEFAVRANNGKILINECFLTLLWCSSYYISVIYNSLLIPYLNDKKNDSEELNKVIELAELAEEIFNYGMSLRPGYDEWPNTIPYPRDFDNNENVETTNIIWSIAANFIISHEIAHIYHKHQPCYGEQSYLQEYEADETSFNWLNKERINSDEFAYQMGIFVALFTTFMMNLHPEKGGDKHPSSFSRFQRILNKFEIDDEHQIWALSLMVFAVWNSRFNKNIEFYPNEGKSYKEKFYDLLEMLMPENK